MFKRGDLLEWNNSDPDPDPGSNVAYLETGECIPMVKGDKATVIRVLSRNPDEIDVFIWKAQAEACMFTRYAWREVDV
jgi:hypothetical protein